MTVRGRVLTRQSDCDSISCRTMQARTAVLRPSGVEGTTHLTMRVYRRGPLREGGSESSWSVARIPAGGTRRSLAAES